MRKFIYSASQHKIFAARDYSRYYTTRKENTELIDTDDKNYHPLAGEKNFKREPGHEKSRAMKYVLRDDVNVVDSLTDDINYVFDELDSYEGSPVEKLAELIRLGIERYAQSDHYAVSDDILELETLIDYASNLEVIENAMNLFAAKTGYIPKCNGFAIAVNYNPDTDYIMDTYQVRKALSSEWRAIDIVNDIMMVKHKANLKRLGLE